MPTNIISQLNFSLSYSMALLPPISGKPDSRTSSRPVSFGAVGTKMHLEREEGMNWLVVCIHEFDWFEILRGCLFSAWRCLSWSKPLPSSHGGLSTKNRRSPGPEHDRSSFKAQQLKTQIKAAGGRLDIFFRLRALSWSNTSGVGWRAHRSTELQKGVLMGRCYEDGMTRAVSWCFFSGGTESAVSAGANAGEVPWIGCQQGQLGGVFKRWKPHGDLSPW